MMKFVMHETRSVESITNFTLEEFMNIFIMQLNSALKEFTFFSRVHSTSPFHTVKCRGHWTDHNHFRGSVTRFDYGQFLMNMCSIDLGLSVTHDKIWLWSAVSSRWTRASGTWSFGCMITFSHNRILYDIISHGLTRRYDLMWALEEIIHARRRKTRLGINAGTIRHRCTPHYRCYCLFVFFFFCTRLFTKWELSSHSPSSRD